MTWTAAILIIVSAFMHATWNLMGKRRNPSLAFFFVTGMAATAVAAPVFALYGRALPGVPASVWALLAATGIAQTIYFTGLAGAYRRGDISLAYPLARALPVLMVAGISLALGRREEIGAVGLAGMVLIAAGCVLLPLPDFRKLRGYLTPVTFMAFVAAVGTTGYTLIDDQALRLLRGAVALGLTQSQVTLFYIALQTSSTTLALGLTTILYAPERRQLARLMASRSLLLSGALTGVIIMATYGLVLAAMAFVTNVSYVAAFRQLSIPIGAVFGLAFLGEPRYPPKLVGVGVVTVGLVLVGVG